MGLAELSSILWRERDLLELLLFKIEEEQLVLAAGRSRWLAHATREVELVLEQIRLTDAVDEPWSDLFRQHRKTFRALTAEISALAETNRELLTAGQRAVQETMLLVSGTVQTYGRRGE